MELIQKAEAPMRRSQFQHLNRKFVDNPEGHLSVWTMPVPGQAYLISADVAEGLEHGDFDSATVWNHMTKQEVAHFHGKMSPFKFAYVLESLGYMYNSAWLVPERNNHGISVIEKLMELEYPNIYVEMIPDPPHKARRRFGWVTSKKSRVLILDTLIEDVLNNSHGIKSKETFKEMLNFKTQNDGKIEADAGSFDDRVMDAAIGRYAMNTLPFVMSLGKKLTVNGQSAIMVTHPLLQRKPPVSAWN